MRGDTGSTPTIRRMGGFVMPVTALMWPLLTIVTLLAPTAPGEAADLKVVAPQVAPALPTAAAIPVAEVATRAAEVLNLLPTLTAQMVPDAQIQAIVTQLPGVSERTALDLAWTKQNLQGAPSLSSIAAQQQAWKQRQVLTTGWLNLLTQRVTVLQATLSRLTEMRTTWDKTRAAAQAASAPAAILQQIDTVLAAIDRLEGPFRTQIATVFELQSQVGQEVAQCGATLTLLAEAERVAMGGMLTRDSLSIWSAEQWEQARATFSARVVDITASRWQPLAQYARDSSRGLPLHMAAIAGLMLLMRAVRRRVRGWAEAGEELAPATGVFERPYAAALVVPLLYVSAPTSPIPTSLRQLLEVIGLVPVLRLTWPVVDRRLIFGLSTVTLLFALDLVRQDFAGTPGFEQVILVLEMLGGIAALVYALTRGDLRRPGGQAGATEGSMALRKGALLLLAILSIALLAGSLGYMRLARLLASGMIGSGALALTLYAFYRVATGLTAVSLRVWPMRLLRLVERHRDLLNRRVSMLMRWMGIAAWTGRTLDYVGLFQPAVSFVTAVLGARLQRGTMSISLGDVLDFLLTVWLAYLLSGFIRFVLEEDVYPRVRLPRGITYAFSSLLNYVIVAVGFVLALGALGMDLGKVTILASAFGVGIGFGLQGMVNNFVSGLILLFERPIHVGDAVEVGSVSGEVRRIGIRSSTVRSWQGAEIIVPNAQLITEQLTNWTLSDRLRRIDLPVGVNYGAPPRKVMEMLEATARAHPGVLQNPAPQAFFTGFGDSSINFELRAWTADFATWYRIRSELAAAVYDAGYAAGISFPFPQREVRLLRDAPAESAAAQGDHGEIM